MQRRSRANSAEFHPKKGRVLRPMAACILTMSCMLGIPRDTRLPDVQTVSHASEMFDDNSLTVMTANVRSWRSPLPHHKTIDQLRHTIDEVNPDIVCMQEVVDGPELKSILRDYNGVFSATKRNLRGQRAGNLILSTAPLEFEQAMSLPNTTTDEPRQVLVARTLTAKGWLRVGNLHISTNTNESTKQLAAMEQSLALPDLLCGDFNLDSPQQTGGRGRFGGRASALVAYGASSRPYPTFPSSSPQLPIDHIFSACQQPDDLMYKTTRTRYVGSDHDALIAEVAIQNCPSFTQT